MSDSLEEMKIRAQYKHLSYPYLYDGETQSVTEAYGPQATPHAFVFDSTRHLRYEGRVDNSYRSELVTTHEVRDAIDALLAHRDVAVMHTGVFGCSTKVEEETCCSGRGASQDRVATGFPGNGFRCGLKQAPNEPGKEDVAGELLGDMVRLLHPRVS